MIILLRPPKGRPVYFAAVLFLLPANVVSSLKNPATAAKRIHDVWSYAELDIFTIQSDI